MPRTTMRREIEKHVEKIKDQHKRCLAKQANGSGGMLYKRDDRIPQRRKKTEGRQKTRWMDNISSTAGNNYISENKMKISCRGLHPVVDR